MRPPALLLAACLLSPALEPGAAGAHAERGSGSGAAGTAAAGETAALARSRLDPSLAAAARPGAEPVPVWVEFVDKGERGPADLAERLAQAARDLTPEARRRRERAHVSPLVDWLDLPLESDYVRALQDLGFAPYGQSRWFNRVALRASGPPLEQLAALPFVRHVAPVELAMPRRLERPLPLPAGAPRASGREPSLPAAVEVLYGQTIRELQRLNVPAVHDSGYIGTLVNLCLLDDGFNWFRKHEALRPIPVGRERARDFIRGLLGYDAVQDTVEFPEFFSHGTLTLSTAAGRAPGIFVGPAYGCTAILGRTEDDSSEKPIEMVYWGMGAEWADSLGADIISSSLGYNLFPDSAGTSITYSQLDGHTTIITRAAEIAAAKGILVVVSAGNDGQRRSVGYKIGAPADANGDSVLAVGAVDSLGVKAPFSSKGPTVDGRIKPDLAAQGVSVVVASPSGDPNDYVLVDGTSLSAPLVAGLAACLMQARPTWPPVWIIQALKRTASQAAHPDTLLGWGIPDGLAALRYVPDTLHVPPITGPLSIRLAGPNPLRAGGPPTHVRVSLGVDAAPARYHVRVFDAGGRFVRDLGAGAVPPGGSFELPWSGDDAHGRTLPPGLYFLSLDTRVERATAVRVIVLR